MSLNKHSERSTVAYRLVDVLFVCGMYKTGTSLAVHLAEKVGYINIAKETNPQERGFGISVTRYNTNECRLLRRINEKLLSSARDQFNVLVALDRSAKLEMLTDGNFRMILEYLSCISYPAVLKDVRFMYTLSIWLRACKMLGLTYRIIFTNRDQASLIEAWEHAPFTKKILCRSLIQNLQALLDLRVKECGQLCYIYDLEDLKLMNLKIDCK